MATYFGAPLAVGVGAVIVMLNSLRLAPRASSVERESDLSAESESEEEAQPEAASARAAD